MNQDHEHGGGAYEAMTRALALVQLESELRLAKQLEGDLASHLGLALALDLAPELQKVTQLASDWVKELEWVVLPKAKAMVKARGLRNC
jgi:hypothetical protein